MRKFTIKLDSFKINGKSCSKAKITWDDPSCGLINCVLDKKNNKEIKVQLSEDCEDKCFYGTLDCLDEVCSDCPTSTRIRVCPCDDSTDCSDCEECIKGICVSTCPAGEFCDFNGVCSECDPANPCPQN